MKYYLIAGEASGDLHASHLIAALKTEDPDAQFRGFGGDLMEAEGMTLVRHYRDLAYMGIVAVALHARTILKGMRQCKADIAEWKPDVVVLVDYPGFNLKIAKYVHSTGLCPVYYYIAPKLWAWKEYRIKAIKRDVDEIFSILPFEVDFFEKKHGYPIHYVGNPTVDEVEEFRATLRSALPLCSAKTPNPSTLTPPLGSAALLRKALDLWSLRHFEEPSTNPNPSARRLRRFALRRPLNPKPSTLNQQRPDTGAQESVLIALLCGSRTHEIRDNLPRMLDAAEPFADRYRLVIAGAPGIEPDYYNKYIGRHKVEIVYGQTYQLLSEATAALVTSGTATLETALFRVPQVVCYFMQARQLASLLRKLLIKVPYISLVNLIAGREVVPELVADHMTVSACRSHLESILPGGSAREAQLAGYEDMARRLGEPGAPQHAAELIKRLLTSSKNARSIEK